MANTILLKGSPIRKEAIAAGAITPGHLILRDSNGKVAVHATAGGNNAPRFAFENDLVGLEISDAYAAGDQVQFIHCKRGDEVNALVAAGAGAIVIGDKLESAGDGTLRKYTNGVILAEAIQAVDNSAGAAVARIKVEIQ
jgi:hypothetical protein